jgi:uncharacterized protein (TIGR03663 family)
MKWWIRCCVLAAVATIGAAALRLPRLEQRPMHGDEAVHAVKFGELLQKNHYHYDPDEYHGPTLNYFTLVAARLGGKSNFADVTEFTLRIVPVFFGILLVVMVLLLADGLGCPAAVVAAVLTAISPAFIFYSRYYIQEMLLVCFTFGVIACGYRYIRSRDRKLIWALLTGMFLGLCHATKETFIIALGAMVPALVLTRVRFAGSSITGIKEVVRPWHIAAGAGIAAVVSAIFFSSFFSNPVGVIDSIRAYVTYANRAGQNPWHIHPWYYYLQMLLYWKCGSGPIWSEGLIVVLAVAGFVGIMRGRALAGMDSRLATFLAFYTLAMTAAYSAIPYKTPWCFLGFLHGMILLAGVGAVVVLRMVRPVLIRILVVLLLAAGGFHLAWQGYQGSYRFYADSRNPLVYAHPTEDVVGLTKQIEEAAKANPTGYDTAIEVICPGDDYWPLPWYLRSFKQVYWWNRIDPNVPPAPVIIASPAVEEELMKYIDSPPPGQKNLYVPLSRIRLRPKVELRCYVTSDVYDGYQRHLRPLPDVLDKKVGR